MSRALQDAFDALGPLLRLPSITGHPGLALRLGSPGISTIAAVSPAGTLVARGGSLDAAPEGRAALAAARRALAGLPPLCILATAGGIAWAPQHPGTDRDPGACGILASGKAWPETPWPWAETAAALPALLPAEGDQGLLAAGGVDPAALSAHARLARRWLAAPPWPMPGQAGMEIRARRVPGGILVVQQAAFGPALLPWALPVPGAAA